jgi:glutathione S-transferase
LLVEFHNPVLEKDFLEEFLRISPDRRIPVIVEGNQVLIGFEGT